MHSESFAHFYQLHHDWLATVENRQLLATLFELLTPAGFYLLNHQQDIIYWSVGAAKLTGYQAEAVLDRPCAAELGIAAATATTEVLIQLASADGQPLLLKKKVIALRQPDGRFAGAVGLLHPETASSSAFTVAPSTDGMQNFQGMLSRSPAMHNVFHIIQNAAETAATVLVRGESGAGKELVARAIHNLSARHQAPFLAINCAALSSNLLESELFGHVRGAFTGAIKDHQGLFQRAQGGTLFLDEVAELPLELQAKLLRVLQERNFIPVGGDRSVEADVRIVAATHRSIREEVKAGRFREDLMYRLRVVPIFIPPLRERREDIALLIWHFIRQHNRENFRKIEKIDPPAMRVLLDYQWPGNIRELHNVVEYAFAVGRGSSLRLAELPPEFRETLPVEKPMPSAKTASSWTAESEQELISKALQQAQGKVSMAAELVGMSRATFWRKRKQYQL